MRLDILKACIVKALSDAADVTAECSTRIYQNLAPPVSEGEDVLTAVTFELATWPGDDSAISGMLPSTNATIRFLVDSTNIASMNRCTSSLRKLFHRQRLEVTVDGIGTSIIQSRCENVFDSDPTILGFFQQVLEISMTWRTTPS